MLAATMARLRVNVSHQFATLCSRKYVNVSTNVVPFWYHAIVFSGRSEYYPRLPTAVYILQAQQFHASITNGQGHLVLRTYQIQPRYPKHLLLLLCVT